MMKLKKKSIRKEDKKRPESTRQTYDLSHEYEISS